MKTLKENWVVLNRSKDNNNNIIINKAYMECDVKEKVLEFEKYLDIIFDNQDLDIIETRKLIKSNFNQYNIDISDTIKEAFIKMFGNFGK